jgi:recombinational DNA repair protein (RecF pathway)
MDRVRCANCKALVPRENIKVVKGFFICLCCLEYNCINYEVLEQERIIFSDKMNELIRQKEQEKRAVIKIY